MSGFDKINELYSKRRSQLVLAGRYQRPTSHGYWATSNPQQIFDLFNRIKLGKFRSFLDLGSGDGIVVAIASLFTHAEGIEVDADLHRDALDMKKRLGMSYVLTNADYLDKDLSEYGAIFIAPDNYFHRLEKKLVEEFRGTLIIADNIFRPLTLSPDDTFSIRGASFSLYKIE